MPWRPASSRSLEGRGPEPAQVNPEAAVRILEWWLPWAWVASILPKGALPERARPSRGNATSTSVPDEWPVQASQETVSCIQVQMSPPSHPLLPPPQGWETEKGNLRRRRHGAAKQGSSRDSWDKHLLVPRPHAAPRQAWPLACLPGPASRTSPVLSCLFGNLHYAGWEEKGPLQTQVQPCLGALMKARPPACSLPRPKR